jgi:UDP-N-acetylglucosamine 2-epimerase (non-hydrolysing)
MPEEINRLLTDAISDFLFVTEKSGLENLMREGVSESKVFFTGNVMIDSLVNYLPKAESSDIIACHNLEKGNYILVTLHRPSNVDSKDYLEELIHLLNTVSEKRKVIFPIHPRTKNNMHRFGLNNTLSSNVILTDPIGYIDFLSLTKNAELIITDSGGIQEESTYLGVQCITVRNNTERPVTVEVGTNQLIGTDLEKVEKAALEVLCGQKKQGNIPDLWDGRAAERIAQILIEQLKN